MTTHDFPSPNMVINTVDDRDHILGTITRNAVLPTGHNFRVAHLLLSNSAGELLLQQLSRTRERHPLAWGASVACYLFDGEDYEQAIHRRVVQELGFAPQSIEFLAKTAMADGESTKFVGVFSAKGDGPFSVDREHIERVEFVSPAEIAEEMKNGSRVFTPTFRHIFQTVTMLRG